MAFFGLTSLGSQNVFQSAQEVPLSVFSEEEVRAAWHSLFHENDVIATDQIESIIRALYRCPAGVASPTLTLDLIQQQQCSGDRLTLSDFLQSVNRVREETLPSDGAFCEKTCEYKSNEEYRASLQKHVRNDKGPKEKYGKPLTDSQMLGWEKPQDLPTRLPKQSCAETKFASAMVQAGVYY